MQPSTPRPDDDLPPPDADLGVITSGLCATPDDQAAFDAEQAGQPPAED